MTKIEVVKTWRPTSHDVFHTGVYRVPADVSEELAKRAIADGAAIEVRAARKPAHKMVRAAPENKAVEYAPEHAHEADADAGVEAEAEPIAEYKPRRSFRRSRKTLD